MGLHMVCGKALEVKAYTQGGARVKAQSGSPTSTLVVYNTVGEPD